MRRRIRRTILVAKDFEKLLHTNGRAASNLFKGEPEQIYQRVIDDLEIKRIEYLDLQLDVSNLPTALASWFFEGDDQEDKGPEESVRVAT